MKEKILLFILSFLCLFPLYVYCAGDNGKFVVNVSESGTLIDLIGVSNVENVKELTISGNLNGTDILVMRKMTNLEILDMSESNIVEGGVSYYESYTTSLNKIGDYFFREKTNLSTILLPKTITSIGSYTFDRCINLKSIIIPNSVTSIGGHTFSGCINLKLITIPNSVNSIGYAAFSGCSGLTEVNLEDGTTTLSFEKSYFPLSPSPSTFFNCPIESLYLGRHIHPSPFKDNTTLTTLTIGNSVTTIRESAFSGCSGLIGTLTIPNSVTTIEESAFSDCSGLTSLTIPNSVTTIGESAFSGCSGLTETLTIPNSVTSIGSYAFSGCSGLKNIVLEDGTTNLAIGISFGNCPIESLYLGRNVSRSFFGFADGTTLTTLTIGNSVTYIAESAFSFCRGLTSLTIPNSVTTIGYSAFSFCSGLTEINSQNPIPPQAQRGAFEGVDKQNCILYVPIGCTTTYWLHPVWEDFFNIKEKDFPITSITSVNADNEIDINITDEGLKINGCNSEDNVSIYAINGQILYNNFIGNGLITYPFKKGNVYIIQTPKKTLKIIY